MLQLTSRDEAMLDWMNVVRLADVDAIRWALSAFQDDHDGPVSVRRANHWIARMAELGYLGRMRPVYRDRQIVWPTHQASGRSAPRLFRQTMRHEIAVSAVAGRYLAAGYQWTRDQGSSNSNDHLCDGIATRSGLEELVEVEFTPKTGRRYEVILGQLARRIAADNRCRVMYFGTSSALTAVTRSADLIVFRDQRPRLITHEAFDDRGNWIYSDKHPSKWLWSVA